MSKQLHVARKFVAKKSEESRQILATFKDLDADEFQNSFEKPDDPETSLVKQSNAFSIVLNFYGEEMGETPHPLEKQLTAVSLNEDGISNLDEDKCEWFEDNDVKKRLRNARLELINLKTNNSSNGKNDLVFCFGAIPRAFPPNMDELRTTSIADII